MNKKRLLIVVVLLTTFVLFSRPPGPPPPPFPPPPPDTDSGHRKVEYNVDITTNPDDANFKIQGNASTFSTPTRLVLTKGDTYYFTFFKDGYDSKSYTYTCDGSSIRVTLNEQQSYINIKLPKDAQLFINGREEILNWRRGKDWNTFQIFSRNTVNTVKIIYFDIEIEKKIRFDRRTYTLFMDLN